MMHLADVCGHVVVKKLQEMLFGQGSVLEKYQEVGVEGASSALLCERKSKLKVGGQSEDCRNYSKVPRRSEISQKR